MTRLRTARHLAWAAALVAVAGCAGSKPGGAPVPETSAALPVSTSPAALVAYADTAIASGEPELARRALERAASLAPDSAYVWIGYGRYDTATLRFKDAKTAFDRAAGLEPLSPEPHYWLGVAYLKARQEPDAMAEFSQALRLQPNYAPALDAIQPMMEGKYAAAGIPREYASLPQRSSLSRGELGVALAVELGADPDRPTWRSGVDPATDRSAIDAAWGSRWLNAAVARGWIAPYPDGDLHLADPITRGTLAIVVTEIAARAVLPTAVAPAGESAPMGESPAPAAGTLSNGPPAVSFPDLASRNYLVRPAAWAAGFGLPLREGGRFDAPALATGLETLQALHGLARFLGATPVVLGEPR